MTSHPAIPGRAFDARSFIRRVCRAPRSLAPAALPIVLLAIILVVNRPVDNHASVPAPGGAPREAVGEREPEAQPLAATVPPADLPKVEQAAKDAIVLTLVSQPAPRDIKFDDIKLDLKKDQPWDPALLTEGVKKLDGKLVRIRGYILPPFRQHGIKQFVLMRDNMECCFGPGAALHDCIIVDMVGDATASYTVRPVAVTGEFAIRETPDLDGTTRAIYHLDGSEVK